MEYIDLAGTPASGELWSPGPKMSTVWVIGAAGPVVVDTRTLREVHYNLPVIGVPHSHTVITAAKATLKECPASGWPRRYEPRNDIEAAAVAKAQTVLADRKAFDDDWFKRQQRRSQRAPLSKASWQKFVDTQLDDFAVESEALFTVAA